MNISDITLFGTPIIVLIAFAVFHNWRHKELLKELLDRRMFEKILETEQKTGDIFLCRKCRHFNQGDLNCCLLDKKIFNIGDNMDIYKALKYANEHEEDLIGKLYVPCENKKYEESGIISHASQFGSQQNDNIHGYS